MSYVRAAVKAPRLTGLRLRLLAAALDNGLFGAVLAPALLRQMGLDGLRALRLTATPTFTPWVPPASCVERGGRGDLEAGAGRGPGSPPPAGEAGGVARSPGAGPVPLGRRRPALADYAQAYRSGRATPEQVVRGVLRDIRAADEGFDPSAPGPGGKPLRAFVAVQEADVLAQARASGERWRRGQPLSPFDGVPVAVKDELDQVPYPTRGGARVFAATAALRDAAVVARFRAAGAILCGKTNMHELGIGVTGMNPVTGFARNPWNLGHATGGSSAGSAAAVAAGLVPVALGADGGGSIRIPAAFCGVVGLKPTFGRVSDEGALRLCWSVGHVGLLAGSVRDCALAYLLCNEARPGGPPAGRLEDFAAGDLAGLRLGVHRAWFEDARPDVVARCQELLAGLERRGARIIEVEVPWLEETRLAHGLTIASEIAAALEPIYQEGRQARLSAETRINLALVRRTTSRDYLRAQRVRSEAMAGLRAVLDQVDVVVTPTTACPAPPIRPDALASGESDLEVLTEIMRFAVIANFTGVPAISVPAGLDGGGLPVGLQGMAAWWNEAVLLRLAHVAEQILPPPLPPLFFRPDFALG